MYRLPVRRQQASWKSWGGVQTAEAARDEMARIARELASLPQAPGPAVRFLPVVPVTAPEQAAAVHQGSHDAILLYACTGSGEMLKACASPAVDTIIFVRHRSGPIY